MSEEPRKLNFNLLDAKGAPLLKGRAFWGPPWWMTLHCAAATYKPEKKEAFKMLIQASTVLIPCDECCKHLKGNLERYPVDDYIKNNHDLFFWTYILHDAVNQAHNEHKKDSPPKISPTFEFIKSIYFTALGEECAGCTPI